MTTAMQEITFLIIAVLAYFMGSIPTGVIIGKKLKGIDIREVGSKNTGATNAYRVLGPKIGIAVLLLDILKGFIPVACANYLSQMGMFSKSLIVLIGLIAIIGHTFSIFIKFKGGKGVATSIGVFLALEPFVIFVILIIFIVIVWLTRYVSLGSIIGAAIFPFLCYFMPGIFEQEPNIPVVAVGVLVSVYIIWKHKANISRLIKGEENKFKIKREG